MSRKPKSCDNTARKIKKDPLAEYQAVISQGGFAKVLTLSDDDCMSHTKLHISTQSLALDKLLNKLGFPTGRVAEIYGPNHIGKSTILDHSFSTVQKMGGYGVLVDTETARDKVYTERLGVDPSKLQTINFEPSQMSIENVMIKIYETIDFWRDNYPDIPVLIGWDALGGTATQDELEKSLSKDNRRTGGASKLIREAARLLPTKLGNTNIALVICNHEYDVIGAMGPGKRKETYGGGGIKHLSSIRLKLFNKGLIKRGSGEVIGREVGATLEKNRFGAPLQQTTLGFIHGTGIDNIWTIFTDLKARKIIVQSGSWCSINLDGDIHKFQGYSGLKDLCVTNSELFDKLVYVYLNEGV